jgi:benzoate-CoA ligase family protein
MTVPRLAATALAAVPERYNVSILLDQNLEAGRGGKAAIVSGDGEVTYQELFDRACAAGRALQALGLQREQRVLLVLDDSPAFPAAFLGAIRAGIVPIPVNPLFKPDDYRYFLEDSYARAVICDLPLVDKLAEVLQGHDEPVELITVGGSVEGTHAFEDLVADSRGELSPVRSHRDDPAFWLYSSGSTGRPKGVVHFQRDLPYTCETYGKQVLGIREDDVTFSTTKLFHAYGLGNGLSFPYWVGATTVQRPGRPDPVKILDTVERFRPTLFFSVPTLYNAMLATAGADQRDLSSVRACASAAEALPAEVWRRWKQTYGVTILDGIGSTEMLHIFCSNQPDDGKPGSSGKAVPGYDLKLLDEDMQPIPQGETGNLYVRGDSAFAYYWHQQEKTKQTVIGDWIYTGDRYRQDEDGFYWHQGRADDMLKVGGLWVSPVELEATLAEHPEVFECAVVQTSIEGLAKIKAVVICKGETDHERLTPELQEWCKSRLQRYIYPHVVVYTDELPKTLTGKIQRYKLRDVG